MLAYGTHGGLSRIELVRVSNTKKLTKVAAVNMGISSALTHLDWSADSQFLVINSQANELLWLNISSKRVVSASSAKDIDWHTWTCIFGFPVQGIWPGIDYTDVNTVDRSKNGNVLASGDDFGCVKLFRYPCVQPKAEYKDYYGHSSHVTKVKFSANDEYLFTTGGNDKTVFVWETDFGEGQIEQSQPDYEPNEDDPENEDKVDHSKEQKAQWKQERKEAEQMALQQKV